MRLFYLYDMIHCQFFTRTDPSRICNPTKLVLSQLPFACWTDLEEAKTAVSGLLAAKVKVLEEEVEHTQYLLEHMDDTFACDDCGEILSENSCCEYNPDSRTDLWLCQRCYDGRTWEL